MKTGKLKVGSTGNTSVFRGNESAANEFCQVTDKTSVATICSLESVDGSTILPYATVWRSEGSEEQFSLKSSRHGSLPDRPASSSSKVNPSLRSADWENDSVYCNGDEEWLNGSLTTIEKHEAAIFRRRKKEGHIVHGYLRPTGSETDWLNAMTPSEAEGDPSGCSTSSCSSTLLQHNEVTLNRAEPLPQKSGISINECLSHSIGLEADTGFESTRSNIAKRVGGNGPCDGTSSSTLFASVPEGSPDMLLVQVMRQEIHRALTDLKLDLVQEIKHELASAIEAKVRQVFVDFVQPSDQLGHRNVFNISGTSTTCDSGIQTE